MVAAAVGPGSSVSSTAVGPGSSVSSIVVVASEQSSAHCDNKENRPVSDIGRVSVKSITKSVSGLSSTIIIPTSSRMERMTAEVAYVSCVPPKVSVTVIGQHRARQPLSGLPVDQSNVFANCSSAGSNRNQKVKAVIQSPVRQDPRSVIEKRIGAMR